MLQNERAKHEESLQKLKTKNEVVLEDFAGIRVVQQSATTSAYRRHTTRWIWNAMTNKPSQAMQLDSNKTASDRDWETL